MGVMDPKVVRKMEELEREEEEQEEDHAADLPAWRTYARLVLAERQARGKLNMLGQCNILTIPRATTTNNTATTNSHDDPAPPPPPRWPSWVPNWQRPIRGANTSYLSTRRFYASGRSSAAATAAVEHEQIAPPGAVAAPPDPDPDPYPGSRHHNHHDHRGDHGEHLLGVAGRRVATISRVGHSMTGSFAEVLDDVLAWAPRDPASDLYPPSVRGGGGGGGGDGAGSDGGSEEEEEGQRQELAIDAYVEVLVRGRTSDRADGDNPCPSIARLRELLMRAVVAAAAAGEAGGRGGGSRGGGGAAVADDIDEEVTRGFKDCYFDEEALFETREGYMGVAAKGMREGDQLTVILGCDLPLILRPVAAAVTAAAAGKMPIDHQHQHQHHQQYYEVVGPCFAHGLMLGEALKPPLPRSLRPYLPVTRGWALPYYRYLSLGDDDAAAAAGEAGAGTETAAVVVKDDPRLGPLPDWWEEVPCDEHFLPPFVFRREKEKDAGEEDGGEEEEEVSVNDPRMSVSAIQGRGITLESLVLV